ncbi:AAA family ATPase [Phytoactinopolyspora endophytica]|uniref:AAA family ATPase n=1 Tax=Phytoactinopolyspora endophytica TaxID=1642495 RepID=UPI00101D231F|nr:AAA family ATPase [Phytoactinopolyspora endophytica]
MSARDANRRGLGSVMKNGVLVLSGPPCSGKSDVGRVLAPDWSRTSRHYIAVDSIFSLLLPGSERSMPDRMLAYDAAHTLARMLFDRGRTPILECTYSRRRQRASLVQALADIPGAPLWVVEFSVPPDEAVDRYRHSPSHQATDLTEQLVRERALTFPYSEQALQVASATASAVALARDVTAWLRDQPASIDRDRWAAAGKA